jgi:hypothetical protein
MKKLEFMEYICDKNTCHKVWKNCIYASKLKLWVEFLGEFFYGVCYWYTSIKSRTVYKFKIFKLNFIQKYIFCIFEQ